MRRDDELSLLRDVANRLGVGLNYLHVYRHRLVIARMIRQTEDGYLDLAIPYLRERLLELETDAPPCERESYAPFTDPRPYP